MKLFEIDALLPICVRIEAESRKEAIKRFIKRDWLKEPATAAVSFPQAMTIKEIESEYIEQE